MCQNGVIEIFQIYIRAFPWLKLAPLVFFLAFLKKIKYIDYLKGIDYFNAF